MINRKNCRDQKFFVNSQQDLVPFLGTNPTIPLQTVERIRGELKSLEASVVEAGRKRTSDMVCVESVWTSQVRSLLFEIEDVLDSHKMVTEKEDMKELNCLSCLEPMKKGWQFTELTFTLDKLEKRIQQIKSSRDSYPSSTSNEGAVLTWIPTASLIDFSGWKGARDKELPYQILAELDRNDTLELAEGFVQEENEKIFEEVAECYLQELVFRHLIQVVSKGGGNRIKEVSVSEAVLEFVRSEARRVEFMQRHVNEIFPDLSKARRVLVRYDEDRHVNFSNVIPDSSILSAEKLCRLWIAEGFVQEENEKIFEEVAECYLQELVFRHLIQVVSKGGGNRIKEVSVSEAVLEFVRSETRRVEFMQRHVNEIFPDLSKARRVLVRYDEDRHVNFSNVIPDSSVLSAEKLCRLWIAEGFVQEENEKIFEEVAECYLQELVFRHLIQVVSKGGGNRIKEVSVSEAVLEFVRSEVRRVVFMQRHVNEIFPDLSKARRVLVRYDEDRHVNFSNVIPDSSVLRSLFCYFFEEHPRPKSKSIEFDFVKKAKYLRVLEIISPKLSDLPDEIGELINLTYIGLRSMDLKELPSTAVAIHASQALSEIRQIGIGQLGKRKKEEKKLRFQIPIEA
ncbi:hypothetical protein LUZ60_003935 [Juncus effusus]|nr:hypothetical protein LUZ60_003935 [Juncus effusus]